MEPRVVLAAALLLATALAGCAEGGPGGPIKVLATPTDPMTEPLVLEATVKAENYTWDMGDGRPKLDGQRVEHVYGVVGGAFTIRLTTVAGGQETQHPPLRVELGDIVNAAPTLELAVEWQWVQVGENVSLSGAGSVDPEGDTLLFSWFCQPMGPIALAGASHAHGGGGGVPYGGPSADAIPLRLLNGSGVPSPDHEVTGDLCEQMPSGFRDDATVRGSFATAGLYEITMLAKDPANSPKAGSVMMYVSDAPRQAPNTTVEFSGTIQYGAHQASDGALAVAGQTDHLATHAFTLRYPTLGMRFSLDHDDGAGIPAAMGYEIRKGTTSKIPETSEDTVRGQGDFTPGAYTAIVALREGAQVDYTLTIQVFYETDPTIIFEGPH